MENLNEDSEIQIAQLKKANDRIAQRKEQIVQKLEDTKTRNQLRIEKLKANTAAAKAQSQANSEHDDDISENDSHCFTYDEVKVILESIGYDFDIDDFDSVYIDEGFVVSPNLTKNKRIYYSKIYDKDRRGDSGAYSNRLATNNNEADSRYSRAMLFNGVSGAVLKYFFEDEINNLNMGQVDIARKLKADANVSRLVSNMKLELNKKIPDRVALKKLKLQFRSAFYRAKKEIEK